MFSKRMFLRNGQRKKKVVTKPLIFVGVIAGGPNSRLMNGQIIGGKRRSNDHLKNVDYSESYVVILHTP